MNERFIAANDLLQDSFQLAANIYEADFRPDFLVGLWRGGSAVGIAVQEGLDYFGVDFSFLPNGQIVVFEANATMRSHYPEYAESFPYLSAPAAAHVAAFQKMIRAKASR